MSAEVNRHWPVVAVAPPTLSPGLRVLSNALGVIFLLAAFLQIIGFQDFANNLTDQGLSGARYWGGVIIFTELWAAAGFFKIPLSPLFRKFSNSLAVLVAGLWFYQIVRIMSDDFSISKTANFFGKYLTQPPGWWALAESAVFLLLVLHVVDAASQRASQRAKVVTTVIHKNAKKEARDV